MALKTRQHGALREATGGGKQELGVGGGWGGGLQLGGRPFAFPPTPRGGAGNRQAKC